MTRHVIRIWGLVSQSKQVSRNRKPGKTSADMHRVTRNHVTHEDPYLQQFNSTPIMRYKIHWIPWSRTTILWQYGKGNVATTTRNIGVEFLQYHRIVITTRVSRNTSWRKNPFLTNVEDLHWTPKFPPRPLTSSSKRPWRGSIHGGLHQHLHQPPHSQSNRMATPHNSIFSPGK